MDSKLPKKKVLVVTTVGDSLSTNYGLRILGRAVDGGSDVLKGKREELLPLFTRKDEERKPPTETQLCHALAGYTAGADIKDVPCAEVQSLLLLFEWLGKNGYAASDVEVLLIPTEETKVTASIIFAWTNSQADNIKTNQQVCVKAEVPSVGVKFDVTTGALFRTGLAEYAKAVIAALGRRPDNGHYAARFLNVTGGYKGLIPVLSLLGFTETVNVCYCHEKSGEILLMPELPVAWDRRRLDEVRGYVLRGGIHKDEYEKLPGEFKFLFDSPTGLDTFPRSALGELVFTAATGTLKTRFGYGRYLMEKLDAEDKELLDAKLPQWEHLWLGDQIPETVEHSRLHTLRLLGFAYQLFSAYPDLLQEVKGSHGLYLLICALWLHDIGHSELKYKVNGKELPIALMPSLVREWHHYTSAAMIRNGTYIDDTKDKEAVALITEFHRGKMKLGENGDPDFDEPYGRDIITGKRQTLNAKLAKAKNGNCLPTDIEPGHVLLLAAILRFLDGCDVQADRVGDDNYRNARKQRTDWEVSSLQKRLNGPKATHKECHYLAFQKYASPGSAEEALSLLAVSLKDQIEFKKKQFEHFKEHQSIELAFLYVKDNKLCVGLVPARTDEEAVALLQKRAKGIAEEYGLVKNVLKKANVCFDDVYVVHEGRETKAIGWDPRKGGST